MRAHPPEGTDQLAGDYLPSLLAVAPDTRALDVFVKYLYAENPVVSGIAASCLEYFPASTVLHAVADSFEKLGPSEQLAYFATQHNGWTREDEIKIVHATTPFLEPAPSGSDKQAAPYAPTQTSAALKLLRFIFYVPNHAWPANAESAAYANTHVLQAAPDIIAQANVNTLKELALYLGAMPPSSRAHELLLQIAERSDGAAEQARICLAWLHRAADLPLLASILTAPGDADASSRDRSSLPYSLVRAYGNDALPYLEHAVQSSSYGWVRTQSAKELALHNRPVGFQFLLNTIETNQLFEPEIIQWIKDHFSSTIPRDADDRQIADFLRTHATQ